MDGILTRNDGSPVINNTGTIRKRVRTGVAMMSFDFNNSGLLDIPRGTAQLAGNYFLAGGRVNCGLRSAGDYAHLVLPASAVFTGTLGANLIGGYAPADGDSFNLVTSPSFSFLSCDLSLPALPGDGMWTYTSDSTKITVSVGTGLPLVSETASGGNLQLSWPAFSFPGYNLVSATNLTPPVVWQNVASLPQVTNSQNVVSLPLTGDAMFFQLKK